MKNTITFEYRANAFSTDILTAKRKADLNKKEIWVTIRGYHFTISIQDIITIDGKPNPEYKA